MGRFSSLSRVQRSIVSCWRVRLGVVGELWAERFQK